VLNRKSDSGVSKYNEIAKIKGVYSKHRMIKHGSYRRRHKINETDKNRIMKIRK
jgi:hypothetical protein